MSARLASKALRSSAFIIGDGAVVSPSSETGQFAPKQGAKPDQSIPDCPDAAVTESRRRSVEEKLLRRRWRPRARGGGRPGAARRDSLLEHPETPRIDQKTARKVPEMMPKTLSGSG